MLISVEPFWQLSTPWLTVVPISRTFVLLRCCAIILRYLIGYCVSCVTQCFDKTSTNFLFDCCTGHNLQSYNRVYFCLLIYLSLHCFVFTFIVVIFLNCKILTFIFSVRAIVTATVFRHWRRKLFAIKITASTQKFENYKKIYIKIKRAIALVTRMQIELWWNLPCYPIFNFTLNMIDRIATKFKTAVLSTKKSRTYTSQ